MSPDVLREKPTFSLTQNNKNGERASNEVGDSKPLTKVNYEEQQRYPSSKNSQQKQILISRLEKHSKRANFIDTNYDYNYQVKPPSRIPLKEYTTEVL